MGVGLLSEQDIEWLAYFEERYLETIVHEKAIKNILYVQECLRLAGENGPLAARATQSLMLSNLALRRVGRFFSTS